jgi:hypothetical protein
MIRIDELYYNTFLPGLQQKPQHGLHWFDPFGSVKFEDLCSVPPVDYSESAVRYLFWDQEPLHQETVDQTLSKFVNMFGPCQRHIVTSELDSDMVDYVCNTYGFKSHYYFFHGWAALDWYRGYNRSFLMTPPEQRSIVQTFIAPNRIIAGQRQHRLLMLYHIFKSGMANNHISCPAVCPAENISIQAAIEPLISVYPDIRTVFDQQLLPRNFKGETDHPMHSNQLSLFGPCAESLLYVVTETVAAGRRLHLTEKTFKPICLRMPFVIVGTAGSLRYLRSYGFRTFGEFWDESYDDETDDVRRIEKISAVLQELNIMPAQQKQQLFDSMIDTLNHNHNHFYNGDFEKLLWTELQSMIDAF